MLRPRPSRTASGAPSSCVLAIDAAASPKHATEFTLESTCIRTSSAQITEHYAVDELVGRQVLCVCNFEPKRVAGVKSEVLVTGAYDTEGRVVLSGFDLPVPDGTRLC